MGRIKAEIDEFAAVKLACGAPRHLQKVVLSESELSDLESGASVKLKVSCSKCGANNEVTFVKLDDRVTVKSKLVE